jgi:hypothetical protein
VVAACSSIVPIMVDCSKAGAQDELMKRFGVRGFPTVQFLDSNGTKVEDLQGRAAAQVRDQIQKVAQAHSRPVVSSMTLDEGMTIAREQRKLLAVVFMDPSGAESDGFIDLVLSAELEPVRGRFHWVRRPVMGDNKRLTDEAKEHGAKKGVTLLVLDPWAEGDQRELKKVTGFRALRRDLEKILGEAEKRGHPPAEGAATPPSDGE